MTYLRITPAARTVVRDWRDATGGSGPTVASYAAASARVDPLARRWGWRDADTLTHAHELRCRAPSRAESEAAEAECRDAMDSFDDLDEFLRRWQYRRWRARSPRGKGRWVRPTVRRQRPPRARVDCYNVARAIALRVPLDASTDHHHHYGRCCTRVHVRTARRVTPKAARQALRGRVAASANALRRARVRRCVVCEARAMDDAPYCFQHGGAVFQVDVTPTTTAGALDTDWLGRARE